MIEWRWHLDPLTVRDATANNLARELDRRHPVAEAPTYDVPSVSGAVCPASPAPPAPSVARAPLRAAEGQSARAHWEALGDLARQQGWRL